MDAILTLLRRLGPERMVAVLAILGLAGILFYGPGARSPGDEGRPIDNSGDPVIVAAGSIACSPGGGGSAAESGSGDTCQMGSTSDLLLRLDPIAVLALGDNAYNEGTLLEFEESYDPSWGRLKETTRPVPGDREYETRNAGGYYDYFGAAASDPSRGYYSYDIGTWHLVALNSNCSEVGGCGVSSPQGQWLEDDLKENRTQCTLAYWHHPLFSAGPTAETGSNQVGGFWKTLHENSADIILNGHDQNYQRFARQSPNGRAQPIEGIRQFVVGTGGRALQVPDDTPPNLQRRNSVDYGILELTLHPTRYTWRFVPVGSTTFTDVGTGPCK